MKNKWIFVGVILVLCLLAGVVGPSQAQTIEPPGTESAIENNTGYYIPVQGKLMDASGKPVPDGSYWMELSIYDEFVDGSPLCTRTFADLPVKDGLFAGYVPCGPSKITGQQLWLGVKVGTDSEMTPRQIIDNVPYALSLAPGAVINSTTQDVYTLRLYNHGPNADNQALRAYSQNSNAIYALTDSVHAAVSGESLNETAGIGLWGHTAVVDAYGVVGLQTGYDTGDNTNYKSGGLFGGRNGVIGITKANNGYGVFGWDKSPAGGWAGRFVSANGNGISITTPSGKTGLIVQGGTKNAAVNTDEGTRLLYSEESTEVWFSDYSFGKLESDKAMITIDPLFAQTVNLKEPYHVFIQVYGNAEVYVSNRTPTSFEVHLRDGDSDVEFSYRIVAVRLGYESTRLEPAPEIDAQGQLQQTDSSSLP